MEPTNQPRDRELRVRMTQREKARMVKAAKGQPLEMWAFATLIKNAPDFADENKPPNPTEPAS